MTIKQLREEYTHDELCCFPGNRELRYKAFAPLLENLYESKIIYHERGVGWLIRMENLEITPTRFSATAVPICVIYNRRNLGGFSLMKKWNFFAAWDYLLLCDDDSFIVPYASYSIRVEADIIKRVEKLISENKIEEIYDVVWEKEINAQKE